jgi:hypothetical protein
MQEVVALLASCCLCPKLAIYEKHGRLQPARASTRIKKPRPAVDSTWRHGKPFRNGLFCFISGLHRTMTGSIAGFLALLLVHPAPRFGSADLSLERRRE